MNTCVISDLPPLNNSSSLRFFTILASKEGALAKKKTSSSFSLEDVEEVEEEEEEFNDEEEEIDEEGEEEDDDDETERRWMEDERITNATRIDVRELTDTLYDENTNEINLTTARSKSYLKKNTNARGNQQPEHGRREQELFQGSAGGGKNSDHFL